MALVLHDQAITSQTAGKLPERQNAKHWTTYSGYKFFRQPIRC